jgi:hypothetical protein
MRGPACELTTDGEPSCQRGAVVRIEDRTGESRPSCELHATRALRAIDGVRVYPLPGQDGAAIAVYLTARGEGRP